MGVFSLPPAPASPFLAESNFSHAPQLLFQEVRPDYYLPSPAGRGGVPLCIPPGLPSTIPLSHWVVSMAWSIPSLGCVSLKSTELEYLLVYCVPSTQVLCTYGARKEGGV